MVFKLLKEKYRYASLTFHVSKACMEKKTNKEQSKVTRETRPGDQSIYKLADHSAQLTLTSPRLAPSTAEIYIIDDTLPSFPAITLGQHVQQS